MAHYAWLNQNNLVVNVTVGVDENVIQQGIGGSSEAWEAFYSNVTGYTIKRTSYNNNIRKQYAGIGYSYDPVADVFIAPQPYASWSLDNDFNWQPPTPIPDGRGWYWNEAEQVWLNATEL